MHTKSCMDPGTAASVASTTLPGLCPWHVPMFFSLAEVTAAGYHLEELPVFRCFQKLGARFWSPSCNDHCILGPIWGPPILGSSFFEVVASSENFGD